MKITNIDRYLKYYPICLKKKRIYTHKHTQMHTFEYTWEISGETPETVNCDPRRVNCFRERDSGPLRTGVRKVEVIVKLVLSGFLLLELFTMSMHLTESIQLNTNCPQWWSTPGFSQFQTLFESANLCLEIYLKDNKNVLERVIYNSIKLEAI